AVPPIKRLSENRLRRGGQSQFTSRTQQIGTVPGDFRIAYQLPPRHARMLRYCLTVGLLLGIAAPAWADAPWNRMTLFKKIDADPNESYPLSEQQGPWLIMAYTFNGPDSQ